jgi:hypothetical protein
MSSKPLEMGYVNLNQTPLPAAVILLWCVRRLLWLGVVIDVAVVVALYTAVVKLSQSCCWTGRSLGTIFNNYCLVWLAVFIGDDTCNNVGACWCGAPVGLGNLKLFSKAWAAPWMDKCSQACRVHDIAFVVTQTPSCDSTGRLFLFQTVISPAVPLVESQFNVNCRFGGFFLQYVRVAPKSIRKFHFSLFHT